MGKVEITQDGEKHWNLDLELENVSLVALGNLAALLEATKLKIVDAIMDENPGCTRTELMAVIGRESGRYVKGKGE